MTAETFFSMFKPDSARQAQKEKEEEGRETAKAWQPHFRLRLSCAVVRKVLTDA